MTAEHKHTPGPWDYFVVQANWRGLIRIEGSNESVAAGKHVALMPRGAESEANARLIAAAPDLLAMLKVAQLWLDVDGRFDMQGINTAIAKAEG